MCLSMSKTIIKIHKLRSPVGVILYTYFISIKRNIISKKRNSISFKRIPISIKRNTVLIKRNTISLKRIAISITRNTISLKRNTISILEGCTWTTCQANVTLTFDLLNETFELQLRGTIVPTYFEIHT